MESAQSHASDQMQLDESIIQKILQSDDLKALILKTVVQHGDGGQQIDQSEIIQKLMTVLSAKRKPEQGTTKSVVREQKESSHVSTGAGFPICPIIPINDLRGDYSHTLSKEERQNRCQLASLHRIVDMHNWNTGIYNHITMRVSGQDDAFLMGPFGLLFSEITASSLVKLSLSACTSGSNPAVFRSAAPLSPEDGGKRFVLDPGSTLLGVNAVGLVQHSVIYAARPDIRCVIHVHQPDVVAVASMRQGLLPLCQEAVELLDPSTGADSLTGGGPAYLDYHGQFVDATEAEEMRRALGPTRKLLLLRNHGLLVCGGSVAEAWLILQRLVVAAETQIRMLQLYGGQPPESFMAGLEMGGAAHKKDNETEQQQQEQQEDESGEGEESEVRDGLADLSLTDSAAAAANQQMVGSSSAASSSDVNGGGGEAASSTPPTQRHAGAAASAGGGVGTSVMTASTTGRGELEFDAMMRLLDNAGFRTGHIYRQPNLLRKTVVGAAPASSAVAPPVSSTPLHHHGAPAGVAAAGGGGADSKQKAAQRNNWMAEQTAAS